MILPCPENLIDYKRFPLALTLVALNVFIFILIFSGTSSTQISSSKILKQESLITTGRIYHQYLTSLPLAESSKAPGWVAEMQASDTDQLTVLGAYALRDGKFLEVAENLTVRGDQIQIAEWKASLKEFRDKYKQQLLYRFGLSSLEMKPLSWITYQFSHSNWMHLLSNVVFLVVIGVAVEALAGSGVLLFVYIMGGIIGGYGFLLMDPHGSVPMVGASASISALLAFYCVTETRKRIQYFYFVSPMPGHYGPIHLPTLLIIPLFLVSDVANLWSTPEGLGSGVAYAAHLGGAVFGAFAGLIYRFVFRNKWRAFASKFTL